jgi:tetratricopeptide (TPR) repeat protein
MNPNFQNHNILYNSEIHAGGNVQIGDVYYNVAQDFKHSILFLRIDHEEGSNYTAQLTLKSRHDGKGALSLPLLRERIQLTISAELFNQVSEFQNIRRNSGANFRKNDPPIPEALLLEEDQLSQILFDTFFKGDILTVCQDFVALLEKQKIEELLLAISVNDTAVVNLPFEMVIPQFFPVKLAQPRESLAVDHFGLVRTLEKDLASFDMQGKTSSAAPLKMLFVTALPENMDERDKLLEIEEEQKRLINAIGSFEATGGQPKIVIEFLDTASLHEIGEALRKHQHDILHISGHGSYQKDVKQGVLHLEDEEGNHCEVTGAALGEALRGHQCVKLLILSACETAIAGNGVVEQLAEFGLPAIVAMRFSVTDIGAKIFTTALYEAILKGNTLTHAIAYARERMWEFLQEQRKLDSNSIYLAEWFTPVVYLNQYTEALVNLKKKYVLPADFYPRSEFLKSKNTRLIGSGFIGRKRYLNALRRSFAKGEHVCLHGLGGMGKTTLAEAFAHNYENHNYEVIIFRNGNQIAEKFILDELFARFESDEAINKNTVRQIKQYLESDANPQEKLQVLIDNYLQNRKTILVFDNFEDVQKNEVDEQQQTIGSASLAEFMTYLCQNTPPNCHLLFTTRYKIVDLAEHLTHLALDKMTYAEQYRLTNFSETLRKIPLSERQDILKRLDGHPRAYEFLETLLKKDKTLTWTNLSTQIGNVEAQVWENLLLEKIYQRLNPEEQQLLQVCAVFISRTPIRILSPEGGVKEFSTIWERATNTPSRTALTPPLGAGGLDLLGLCFYDNENQTIEVHRLTREWMIRNIIADENLKQWAFLAGKYFSKRDEVSVSEGELAKDYFEIAEAWEDFAKISFRLQDYYQLRGLYQRAFELNNTVLARDINAKINADALNFNGMMLYSIGEYKTALTYLEQSLAITQQISDQQGEGANLNNIGQIYASRGDYETALTYLKLSLLICKKIRDRNGEGSILDNIGQIYNLKGDYETALTYLEQALLIKQQNKDRDSEGITLNNLGVTAHHKSEYETALIYFEKALTITKKIGNRKAEGATLNNISQIYESRGNYETALTFLEQSLVIQQQIGDRKGEGTTLSNISHIYYFKGDYIKTLTYLKKSLAIMQQIGDRQGEGGTLNNLSQIYSVKGDYETALGYLQQSLNIQQQIGDIAGMATTLHNIGAIFFNDKKDFENAISFFMQSYKILKKIGSPDSQAPEGYLNEIIRQIGEQKFQEIVSKLEQQ